MEKGADWYAVTGGMQDWSYIHGGTFELTLELGCFKFPNASELSRYWMDNREALIKYIEQSHIGIKGLVASSIGTKIPNAAITVDNKGLVVYSGANGDYFRLLLPGKYNVTASANGYDSYTAEIVVPETGDKSVEYSFSLMRNDPQHWSSGYDYRVLDNIINVKYHDNQQVDKIFTELQTKNVKVVLKETSENEDYYNSLKVTSDVSNIFFKFNHSNLLKFCAIYLFVHFFDIVGDSK